MYHASSPTPSRLLLMLRRSQAARSDGYARRRVTGVVLAGGLTIGVAAGLVVAGGSRRPVEIVVLIVGTAIAFAFGWPLSGHAALWTAATYLILETVFGRLDRSHLAADIPLTVGVLGSVAAAGFLLRRDASVPPADRPADQGEDERTADEPGPDATSGSLEDEVGRARRAGCSLSLLAIQPDQLGLTEREDFPASLSALVDGTIDSQLRAVGSAAGRSVRCFELALPKITIDGARPIAEQIRLLIGSSPGAPRGTTVSIGVATYPADGADAAALAEAADRALRRAAELGGNRTVLCSLPAGAPPGWALSGS